MLAFTRTMLLWFSFDTSNSRGILKNIACVLSRMVVLRCVLSGMDKMVKNIIQPTNTIAATPGFSACLFGLQKIQPKESHFGWSACIQFGRDTSLRNFENHDDSPSTSKYLETWGSIPIILGLLPLHGSRYTKGSVKLDHPLNEPITWLVVKKIPWTN